MLSSRRALLAFVATTFAFAAPAAILSCQDLTPFVVAGGSGGASGSGSTGSTTSPATTSAQSSASSASSSSSASGSSSAASSSASSGGAGDAGDAGDAASLCKTQQLLFPVNPSPHVTECSPVLYPSEPPTSGPHYPYWAAFKTYTSPVPRGFYVHDLEHGAVVILYNCPNGCAPELAQLQAFLDARPVDPLCAAPVKNRFVVTPDPLSDVPFAVAAWGAALRSQCFDLTALGAFLDAHYATGPENFCADGVDVNDPAAGIPANCGVDLDAGDAGGG